MSDSEKNIDNATFSSELNTNIDSLSHFDNDKVDNDKGKEVNNIDINKIWNKGIKELKSEIDSQIFKAYLRPLKLISYNSEKKELLISAPSKFISANVENNFLEQITDKFTTLFKHNIKIKLSHILKEFDETNKASNGLIDSNSKSIDYSSYSSEHISRSKDLINSLSADSLVKDSLVSDQKPSKYLIVKKIPKKKELDNQKDNNKPSGIMSRYTFSNFVVGSGNQFCHAAAQHVAEKPGIDYNPLFIYGGVGLGKTHLLHAIGNALLEKDPTKKVVYLSSETFTNELIMALRFAKMDEFKKHFRNIDLLLIDDIQFMCGKERTQEEFFHTFNALYSAKHQIVITSDKVPQEIPGLEERLKTRFAWGLTADIQAPDFETRVAILNRKAAADGCALPEDVAHFVADRITSNVRELEGALTRLNAHCSLQRVKITKETAESVLRPLFKKRKMNITIEDIQKVVAEHFGIKVSEMVSKRRTKNLSFPRHVAMYLCRKHTTSSYPDIGYKFGGRDHSSVIHAANVVDTKVNDSSELKNTIEEIEKDLIGG